MVSSCDVATSTLFTAVCSFSAQHQQLPTSSCHHSTSSCRCITCQMYTPLPHPAPAPLMSCCATVVLACRSQSKGDAMVKELSARAQDSGQPAPSLEVSLLDLSSLESVRSFVQRWEQRQRPVHILINNAGLFNLGGEPSLEAGAGEGKSTAYGLLTPVHSAWAARTAAFLTSSYKATCLTTRCIDNIHAF